MDHNDLYSVVVEVVEVEVREKIEICKKHGSRAR